MKTNNILQRIQNHLEIRRYERKQKLINKLVNTEGLINNTEVAKEVNAAKQTIANYAKKNLVSVDIFDTTNTLNMDKNIDSSLKESLKDKITVRVRKMLTGKSQETLIPSDTTKLYEHTQKRPLVFEDVESGVEHISFGYTQTEDSFLRNLYRHILKMTNDLNGKKS